MFCLDFKTSNIYERHRLARVTTIKPINRKKLVETQTTKLLNWIRRKSVKNLAIFNKWKDHDDNNDYDDYDMYQWELSK